MEFEKFRIETSNKLANHEKEISEIKDEHKSFSEETKNSIDKLKSKNEIIYDLATSIKLIEQKLTNMDSTMSGIKKDNEGLKETFSDTLKELREEQKKQMERMKKDQKEKLDDLKNKQDEMSSEIDILKNEKATTKSRWMDKILDKVILSIIVAIVSFFLYSAFPFLQ